MCFWGRLWRGSRSILFGLLSLGAAAQTSTPPQTKLASAEFFEMRVRPVLARNCFACHAHSSLGGLRPDSREGLFKGGKSGPAIVPGMARESLLIAAVQRTHPRLKMPPQGSLKTDEIADLKRWVDEGAIWASQPRAKT